MNGTNKSCTAVRKHHNTVQVNNKTS